MGTVKQDEYILFWSTRFRNWCYGGTYPTKALALENAKKELSGRFDYRIEKNGDIIEQGTERGDKQ